MSEAVRRYTVLTADAARAVLDGAVAEAARIGVACCVAVADRAGDLLAYLRMDGAPLLSEHIARNKAYTVAAFNGQPTHEWWSTIADDPPLRIGIVHTDRLVIFGGGVPVRVNGELVGTIGVSGGTADQDRHIAEAGASAAPQQWH